MRRLAIAGVVVGSHSSVLSADTTTPTAALYSRSYVTNHYVSEWSGTAWGTEKLYSTGPDEAIWMRVANCPTRNDFAVATLDYNSDVRVMFCSSGAYGSSQLATSNTGGYGQRRFDAAYEQLTGDFLVVYWNEAGSNLGYRTASATTLSAQGTFALPSTDDVQFLSLVPRVGGNDMAMLCSNSTGALYGSIWLGSSWYYSGALTSSLASPTKECFGVALEATSGDALVVYGVAGSAQPKYMTYVGGTLSAEMSMSALSGVPQWVKMCSKSGTNTIVAAMVDANNALYACVWNGSAWGSLQLLQSNVGSNLERRFDLCFEPGGSNLLVAYSNGGNRLRYRTWNGTTWSSETTGPNFGGNVQIVQLAPLATGSSIVGLCTDSDWQLNAFGWNGSAIMGDTMINDPLGGESHAEAFGLVARGAAARKVIKTWKQIKP